MTSPLHYETLAAMVTRMKDGSLSAAEVTDHHLERIAALEPTLHAFASVRADEARAEARAADDRRRRGEALGPLHGAPIAVKDLCAMRGTRTGAGGFFSTGFGPDDTATVVRRLEDAGAIIIGKTQLTEGAWGAHHPDIPIPVNPWAAHRWSGSSSSGSGVSVAAGFAAGAIGTDTAGSIRFPSSVNGLVGLKPTWGRVSRHGVFPLSDTLDHIGPMTRSVLDAALVFEAIAGPDAADVTSLPDSVAGCVAAARAGSLRGVRIGVDRRYAIDTIDPLAANALRAALEICQKQGARIVEIELPELDGMIELAIVGAFAEAAVAHARTYPAEKARYSAYYSTLLEIGLRSTGVELARLGIWRREFAGALARLFSSIDLMAAPVMPVLPLTIVEMAELSGAPPLAAAPVLKFTIPFNFAGVPTLTLPASRMSDGTPLGFQLIGPALGERSLLSAGAAYEQAADYTDAHPPL